ncbi:MAG: alpha/beta hydrolase [Culicoidibacterales bacterium]
MEFKTEQLYFEQLGYEKKIYYYQPEGKVNGIIYFHDGQNLFVDELAGYGRSWRVLDFLKNNKQYQNYAVVGIEHGKNRFTEYSPWITEELDVLKSLVPAEDHGGHGYSYIDDLANIVVPYFENKFDYKGSNRVLCGSSMGGMISIIAGICYPELFSKVAGISNAIWFAPNAFHQFVERTRKFPEFIFMTIGDNEAHGEIKNTMYIDENNRLAAYLTKNGILHEYRLIEGGIHNESDWEKLLPDIFDLLKK